MTPTKTQTEYGMIEGKLRIMGDITVYEESGNVTGLYNFERALLIEFDSVEDIRKAIEEGKCEFTFGE